MPRLTPITPSQYENGLLLDADVLIDFAHADRTILRLVAENFGPARVLLTTVAEVHDLTPENYPRFGIEVVAPTPAQRTAAGAILSQASEMDLLCFVVCRDYGWTLATNDGILRKMCERHGVRLRYGLELILDLVARGKMSRSDAESVAERLHTRSPTYFHPALLQWFRSQLDERAPP